MLKTTRTALCPASCVQGFKANAWGGRGAACTLKRSEGVGTPAPQLRLAPAKFGAGKFCRFKEQIVQGAEISFKTHNFVVNYQ